MPGKSKKHDRVAIENAERDGELAALRLVVTTMLTNEFRGLDSPKEAADVITTGVREAIRDLGETDCPLDNAMRTAFLRTVDRIVRDSLEFSETA